MTARVRDRQYSGFSRSRKGSAEALIELTNAFTALQKLEKKIRRLRERGAAKPIDVAYCTYGISLLRGIAKRHGVEIDGRVKRGHQVKTPSKRIQVRRYGKA